MQNYTSYIDQCREYGIESPIIHNAFFFKNFKDMLICETRFGWQIPESKKETTRNYEFLKNQGVNGCYISSRGNPEFMMAILK